VEAMQVASKEEKLEELDKVDGSTPRIRKGEA